MVIVQHTKFDNNNFLLIAPDSLDYITKDLESILDSSLNFYKELFEVDNFRKVQINYFDDIDNFRNFIFELRGEKQSLPEYAAGTFDNGMINAFIKPDIIEGTPLFNKRKYNASHELFHIMYQELVWEKNNQDRIVWFDEGMAQYFSGEYKYRIEDDFAKYYDFVKSQTIQLPKLNNLEHGYSFCNDKYNGYDLSYLSIRYLNDILNKEEFIKLMSDFSNIKKYGNDIVTRMFIYYDEKFGN